VANWPEARKDAFLSLIKARAIENQCYVAAVNRVGLDGQGLTYAGDSVIVDPKGLLLTPLSNKEGIIQTGVSLDELHKFRNKFPTHLDADDFEIK
jgi:predicted amidohydrolase